MASLWTNPAAAFPKQREFPGIENSPQVFFAGAAETEEVRGQWSGSVKDAVGRTLGLQQNQLLEVGE